MSSQPPPQPPEALWDLAAEVARALGPAAGAGAVPNNRVARLLTARCEVEAREQALSDAHLALLAERNLYLRRLVTIEHFVQGHQEQLALQQRQEQQQEQQQQQQPREQQPTPRSDAERTRERDERELLHVVRVVLYGAKGAAGLG